MANNRLQSQQQCLRRITAVKKEDKNKTASCKWSLQMFDNRPLPFDKQLLNSQVQSILAFFSQFSSCVDPSQQKKKHMAPQKQMLANLSFLELHDLYLRLNLKSVCNVEFVQFSNRHKQESGNDRSCNFHNRPKQNNRLW